MRYIFEHTDTFGGDANYCWVNRESHNVEAMPSKLALVRRAKAFAGFTGLKCEVLEYGDCLQITPSGLCQTVFVIYEF